MTELIITEKPAQAQKIAEALADGKPKKIVVNKVAYYEITHKNKDILVGCAVGHLYSLAEKKKNGLTYPVFDIEWKPAFEIKKASEFSEKYLNVLKKLAKKADSFVIGCDFDVEGSLLGFNILRFVYHKNDAKRMKFSTLTKDELVESYEHAMPHLDFPLIEAGETRHKMDYFWGISLSRALMSSIKAAGSFKILSAGRVQGPALKIVVDREHEIKNFKPEPFWQLELKTKDFSAWHKKDKFFDRKEFDQVLQRAKGKDAIVSKLSTSEVKHAPPFPFDLTTLQTESYRYFGISPKETLSIAQDLYTAGLISYPRTSSQKLPPSLGFKKIMNGLSKQTEYKTFCDELSKGKMLPNEGNKTDPAHPAIFPTGEKKKITDRSKKIYDLIVRRFLATFSIPAVRETLTADIDVGEEPFIAKGMRTLKKGWYEIYYFPKLKEEELPKLKEGQKLYPYELTTHDEQTQPPNRYNQASLIKALEELEIGTKSTRAAIIDNLYQRNYIMEKAIVVTELGMKTVETLGKYSPEILDPELTRHFEHDMDSILEQKHHQEEILEDAKKELTKILDKFRKHEKEVGVELLAATRLTQDNASTIGPCAACKEGTMMVRRGKFGLFIACNKYPKCKTTSSLPKNSTMVKPTEKFCETCKHPIVIVFRKGKRPFNYCTNKQCPIKLEWIKQQEEKKNNSAAPAA